MLKVRTYPNSTRGPEVFEVNSEIKGSEDLVDDIEIGSVEAYEVR